MSNDIRGGSSWNHLWETFHAVRGVEPSARTPLLERLCGGDLDLKREVQQLLDADQVATSPLDRPPLVVVGTEDENPPVTVRPGTLLCNRFEVVRLIGQGGMGSVYEALDRSLGGSVALKTLLPSVALHDGARRRFFREIDLARQVTHPNACRLFDLFEHRDTASGGEMVFVTMELLEGETLAERLRRAPLSPADALEVARQIAAALDAAHSSGIVHRDLKPGNIMLTGKDGVGRVVVTDFGLALRPGDSSDVGRVTRSGQFFGTPDYMAPEQLLGGEISPATDVYAFGILLYEMITGSVPFRSDSPFTAVIKRLHGEVPSPRQMTPTIDDAWERTIVRCLERDPRDRFQSVSDVIASLAGARLMSRPRMHRRAIAWATAAVLGIVLVLALVIMPGFRDRASTPRKSAASDVLAFRRIWTGDNLLGLMGTVSRDGRFMSFVDWTTGDLALRDLSEGKSRRLTDKGPWSRSRDFTEHSAISPDGRRVAYGWGTNDGFELRSIGMDLSRPQLVHAPKGLLYVAPFDWTPDGQNILALLNYPELVRQIALVSADDGAVTTLKSWNRRTAPTAAGVSSDGRFIAYDLIDDGNRDIFVMSVADRSESRLIEHPADDRFLDWTPDGKHLLFLSSRGGGEGEFGLWSMAVEGAKAKADPRLIRGRIGAISPIGFARDASYFYATSISLSDVFEARLTTVSLLSLAKEERVDPNLEGRADAPSYSRDGRSLAFIGEKGIEIRTTGEAARRVPLEMRSYAKFSAPAWWPDGGSLVVTGTDREGVNGFHRVDVVSGSMISLLQPEYGELVEQPFVSPDGQSLYYISHGFTDTRPWKILARDLRTGVTREIHRSPAEEFRRMDLSPDGQAIALIRQRGLESTLETLSAARGEPRTVLRFQGPIPDVPRVVKWAPNGKSILFTRSEKELWHADPETGTMTRVASMRGPITHVSVDSVHRRVAFASAEARNELWVIENLMNEIERTPAP